MHAAPHIPQRPADGLPMPQRLGAILAVAFGVSLSVIDGTVANVALPTIGQQLGISAADSIWIVNAYQLAIMVSLLSLSALGDVVGYRKVYIGGLMLFTVASVGCSLSGSLQALVLARVMQGFGAAAITSVNTSLIRFIYPKARLGRGMGVNATVVATSSVAGPTHSSLTHTPSPPSFPIPNSFIPTLTFIPHHSSPLPPFTSFLHLLYLLPPHPPFLSLPPPLSSSHP